MMKKHTHKQFMSHRTRYSSEGFVKGEFNLPETEKKILSFWKSDRTFEKSLDRRKGKKKFVFYEGPPYANGKPGIHHVLARIYKDIILRYKTMRGYLVPRRAGWDTHGLPVEIAAEKALGLKSKKDIEKFGIEKFNEKAKEAVWIYKDEWERMTERIGYWLDLKNAYVTYGSEYIETLWWILKRLWEKKLLYRGHKVISWCPRCGTALSSHELAQGYKEVVDQSVYVKFKVKSSDPGWKNTSILSWTTTPWTLPGNVALAINPSHKFVCVADPHKKGHWLVLELESFKRLLGGGIFPADMKTKFSGSENSWRGRNVDFDIFSGRELVSIKYEPLFHIPALKNKNSHKVYAADFVTTTDGTGVVHTAVMYGEDDYKLGVKVGLPQHHTVDESGKFTKEVKELAGRFVKDKETEEKIFTYLKKKNYLFHTEPYTHEYPFCWRCETPTLYYARNSWFIAMGKLRTKLLQNNKKINWVPAHLKEGRFGEWLREVKDWNLSRERYWGAPLPIWECTKCRDVMVMGSLGELDRHAYFKNRFIVVRHTQAEHNVDDVWAAGPEKRGRVSRLTEKGLADAKKIAAKLAREKLAAIYTSPLLRARTLAKLVSKATGAKVIVDRRIDEVNPGGAFNWRPCADHKKFFKNPLEEFTKAPEGGETLNEVKERMMDFIRDVHRRYRGKTILVVSHGDPLWLLQAGLEGISNEDALSLSYIEPGEVREIAVHNWPYGRDGSLDLHRPYVDEVRVNCGKCGKEARRVPEVVDVWFDSGAMPFAQGHFPFACANPKSYVLSPKSCIPYPADYIAEGMDQTRGWFYTLLAVATALGYEAPYKNVVSLGLVNDKFGQKMSKSKGNVVEPFTVIDRYGADAVRWYFYTVNPPGETKNFDEQELQQAFRRFHLILWNSFVFWKTYADKNLKPKTYNLKPHNILDKWIVARLEETTEKMTRNLERYEVREAALALESFAHDLSRWYIRRSRRRFSAVAKGYGGQAADRDYQSASLTLGFVIRETAKLSAPFTPFFAEAIYSSFGKESVHLADWPMPGKLPAASNQLLDAMAEVRRIASAALAKRAEAGIRVRQPLGKLELRTEDLGLRGSKELLRILAEEVNVKSVAFNKKLKEGIALDIVITPELKEEGILRELVRAVQDLRQKANLEPKDKIVLMMELPKAVKETALKNEKFLKQEVGAKGIEYKKSEKFNAEILTKFEGEDIWLAVRKVR